MAELFETDKDKIYRSIFKPSESHDSFTELMRRHHTTETGEIYIQSYEYDSAENKEIPNFIN